MCRAALCWWAPHRSSFLSASPAACEPSRCAAWPRSCCCAMPGLQKTTGRKMGARSPSWSPQPAPGQPGRRDAQDGPRAGSFHQPGRDANLDRLIEILQLRADKPRLIRTCCKGGIPHEVLNARKHTEESQIIAGAGAFGAVTIATNMAGRGVDIKLGGELAEEVSQHRQPGAAPAGTHENPYNMRWKSAARPC
jgi:hypothetical protein